MTSVARWTDLVGLLRSTTKSDWYAHHIRPTGFVLHTVLASNAAVGLSEAHRPFPPTASDDGVDQGPFGLVVYASEASRLDGDDPVMEMTPEDTDKLVEALTLLVSAPLEWVVEHHNSQQRAT